MKPGTQAPIQHAPRGGFPKTIQFYGIVGRESGRGYDQVLVTKRMKAPGVLAEPTRQEYTGISYTSFQQAETDLVRLNCGGAK